MPDDHKAPAFDPIPLTLAVWLGLIVSVSSIARLAQDAAARHEAEDAARTAATTLTDPRPHPALIALGAYS